MKSSQLAAIIKRLEAMQDTTDGDVQTRRFEKDGVEKGMVSYDAKTDTYTLEELDQHQQFDFDDIDLVAMEIYDLLGD